MRNPIRHLRRNERGMSMVFVGLGFMAFLSATTLAIDIGMFMTARNQAQNSADAGALAGATALGFNSFTNHSASGPAVLSALHAATDNEVMFANVSVTPSDVTFLPDPAGRVDRVKVDVYRTTERGNPIPTLMGRLFGVDTVNIAATATAEAAPAGAETCVKPFTIPDRWKENQDPMWTVNSTFDAYDSKGNPLPNADVYYPPSDVVNYRGYNAANDSGLQLVLKSNNSSKIAPSMYNPYDEPGSIGAADYSNDIAKCNPWVLDLTNGPFLVPPENGNMVGPTKSGVDQLVAEDSGAYWDGGRNADGTTWGCNCVKKSIFPISPRVVIIPLYDPQVYAAGQASGKNAQLLIVNFIGFFIDSMNANGDVTGHITPVAGQLGRGAGAGGPSGFFPVVIRLVQ